jgi:hypothetical protein
MEVVGVGCIVLDLTVGEEVGAGVLTSLIGDQDEIVAGLSHADRIRRMKMEISSFFMGYIVIHHGY